MNFIKGWIDRALKGFPENSEQRGKARSLAYCGLFSGPFAVFIASQLAQYGTPTHHWGLLVVFGFLFSSTPFVLLLSSSVRVSANYLCFIAWSTLTYAALYEGGIHSPALINLPFIPILAATYLSKKDVAAWTLMPILTIVIYFALENKFGISVPQMVPIEERDPLWAISLVVAIFTCAGIFAFYEQARSKLYREVQHQLGEVRRQNDIILDQQRMLVQTAQMSALGEMAGGVAHEINNPLAIISGNADILSERLTNAIDERSLKSIETIQKTVVRIKKVTEGLLRFCRGHSAAEKEICALNSIIEDVRAISQDRFETHGVQLQYVDQSNGMKVECHMSEISQVLLNLLNNAFDSAVSAGQNPWVRVACLPNPEKRAIEVRVYDSGPEIPDTAREKIFHPFFTTKPVGSGTGLGLSISMGIMKSHDGTLRVSEPPEAKYFALELPVKQT